MQSKKGANKGKIREREKNKTNRKRKTNSTKINEKNPDKVICLGAFAFFQYQSYDHGRGLMTSSLVLLIMKKLKHMK